MTIPKEIEELSIWDFSCKNVSSLSEESIEIISREKPSHVNLAKNKFTEMPVV